MPKKILFESAVHHFLIAAQSVLAEAEFRHSDAWREFVGSLHFKHLPGGALEVNWSSPSTGSTTFSYREASFYTRGDTDRDLERQRELGLLYSADLVRERNREIFRERVLAVAAAAGLVAERLERQK